jgi:hypothetical protein
MLSKLNKAKTKIINESSSSNKSRSSSLLMTSKSPKINFIYLIVK